VSALHGLHWLAATALLTACSTAPQSSDTPHYLGGATPALAGEVAPIIRNQTNEPITGIEKEPDGTVKVFTGSVSGGRCFLLKKSNGKWRVITDCIWIFGRDSYTAV
jgi:hypothetical protein